MDYHQNLAIIGVSINFISYIVYFYGVFFGKTKPHGFSWLVWGIMNITVFFAQTVKGGGAGAWISASNGIFCLAVAILSIWRGEKNITKSDWLCLGGAMSAIVVWAVTSNPLFAAVLASITDMCAIIPTIRKAYHKPFEENALGFSIDMSSFVIELFALQSFNLTTALFPAAILFNDSCLLAVIFWRRLIIKKNK